MAQRHVAAYGLSPIKLTISQINGLIDECIFSERDRYIIKRYLIDGLTYNELIDDLEKVNKAWALQERQLKRIVKRCMSIISSYV